MLMSNKRIDIEDMGCSGETFLAACEVLFKEKPQFCIFENVYFSRPDSIIGGRSVYETRRQIGVELAREAPIDADLVCPVPDSGTPAETDPQR